MNKNILFRADSSSSIGTGHIMRGLVLAKQYPDSHIMFTTQLLDGNFNSHVVQSAYQVINLISSEIDKLIKWIKKLKKKTDIDIMILYDTHERHYCDILLNHKIYTYTGFAFKTDIDDLRESPALFIIQRLAQDLDNILACEPNITLDFKYSKFKIQNLKFQLVDANQAVKLADIVVFLVAYKEFKKLNVKTNLDFCGVGKCTSKNNIVRFEDDFKRNI